MTNVKTSPPANYVILVGLYITILLMAILNGVKLCNVFGQEFDGGLLPYAFTFLLLDTVREVYGRSHAIRMVVAGFFALITMSIVNALVMLIPASSAWELAKEHQAIMGFGLRITLAGITTFIVTQSLDLFLFSWVREKMQGRHLWLRYLISNVFGGGLDAFIFTFIAFYGVFPVVPVMISAWIVRTVFAVAGTPVVYMLVAMTRSWDAEKLIGKIFKD
ncbi:MAG: VUT family protein [Alphaproteobacteria bacterium]|nr:VUT family protein [Alphaproteobacteria bacterium]